MIQINRTAEKTDVNKKSKHRGFFYIVIVLLFAVAFLELLVLNSKFGYADNSGSKSNAENKYEASTTRIDDKKNNIKVEIKEIPGAPSLTQMPVLPSGCEAVAATMLLNWAGVPVSPEEAASALPKGSMPSRQNGSICGSNPNSVFIGDPFSDSGLGVYHKPIASLVEGYLPGKAKDISGTGFENVLKEIDKGHPVIVWATMNMAEPSLIATWYDRYGNKVKWIAPEHAFLLTGYTGTDVIVNDPYTGKRQIYSKDTFKSRWESMGSQAVTVSDSISGKVVVTDVTSLTDVKSVLGITDADSSKDSAPAIKKAEQAISEMSNEQKGEDNDKKFIIHFREIYNEVVTTLNSCYNGIAASCKDIVKFFNE